MIGIPWKQNVLYTRKKSNNADGLKYHLPLFFFYYEMYEKWGRESKWLWCTHRDEIRIFSELLVLCSAFSTLVQDHLKAADHRSFYSLFDFLECGTGPSQGSESSSYDSLLYFYEYRQLRLFFTSQPWVVWRKVSVHRSVTSCSSSAGFLFALRSSLQRSNLPWFM